MTEGQALDIMNQLMWQAMIVAGPILAAILLTGLIVSLIQATTQLQEITLSYVPKMLVAALMLIFLGPWMVGRMMQFALTAIRMIPNLG
ncbi:flagellar biosynthetic protein FliQ [Sphingorhabdus arenilitoris]|uniref:Flagellar biosynthetic protein FliQ n=1 Tax=Sphingorhabdus arenilitoris TaxID=1490041 RepID=A0ABV8RCE1_9SPHN